MTITYFLELRLYKVTNEHYSQEESWEHESLLPSPYLKVI